MHLTGMDLLFWAMSFIGHIVLLSVLVLRGRFRNFPIFTSLVALNILRTIVLFVLREYGARAAYFYTFWSLAVIDVGLQFGIVYELSSKIFRPLGEWARDIRSQLLFWIVASVAFTSLLSLIPEPPTSFWMQGLILRGSFFSAALMSELFLVMIAFSAVAGLNWSSHVARIAIGLTLYSVCTLVLETINTFLGLKGDGRVYDNLSRLRIAVYLCCVAYWTVALWRNAPSIRKMPDHLRRQAEIINQVVRIRVETLRQAGEP